MPIYKILLPAYQQFVLHEISTLTCHVNIVTFSWLEYLATTMVHKWEYVKNADKKNCTHLVHKNYTSKKQ